MKKISKQCTVWLLIVAMLTSISSPLVAQVANKEPDIEQAVQQVTAGKKVPLRKKLRLISLFRQLRAAVKEKIQSKRTKPKTLDQLIRAYDRDRLIAMLAAAIGVILTSAGLLVGAAFLMVMAAAGIKDLGEGAAGALVGIPVVVGGVLVMTVGGAVVSVDVAGKAIRDAYQKKVKEEILIPKERERIKLIQAIREAKASANSRKVKELENQLVKIDRLFQKASKEFGNIVGYQTRDLHAWYIDLILEKYRKKISESSPLFPLFKYAIARDAAGLDRFLEGDVYSVNIKLFDEPWVWPAMAELYYLNDRRPTDELVPLLQKEVNWDIWKLRMK